MLQPTDCITTDFTSRWYKKWAADSKLPPAMHPKFWESSAIAEALHSRGVLVSGKSGLGMGVGTEQLVSVFAKQGVQVTATDQDPNDQKAKKWDNGQLAKSLSSLCYPEIVDNETFAQKVTYEPYDMNTYNPAFSGKFDFVWHNCVIGHLGSMNASMKQLQRSAKYLKDGGWLVFTTELNISSLEHTISDNSETIIWRLADIQTMFEELAKHGLKTDGLKLRLGTDPEDLRINYNHNTLQLEYATALQDPAYSEIKIPFSHYAITQVLLCFQKDTVKNATKSYKKYSKKAAKDNVKVIQRHRNLNADLAHYIEGLNTYDLATAHVLPAKRVHKLTLSAGETETIQICYKNTTNHRLYDFSLNTPHGQPPVVLATSNPVNRSSLFVASSWSSDNRPALSFEAVAGKGQVSTAPSWNRHCVEPGEAMMYTLALRAPKQPGEYTEQFCLVAEGQGVLPSSIVDVDITVLSRRGNAGDAVHSERGTITLEQLFERVKVKKLIPKDSTLLKDFTAWFSRLGESSFPTRLSMSVDELATFFETYITDNNHSVPKLEVIKEKMLTLMGARISLNNQSPIAERPGDIYLLAANPRSGNNAIGEVLSRITGWTKDSSPIAHINFAAVADPLILLYHVTRGDFLKEYTASNPYKVVTIVRHPLDILLSAFRFNQHTASSAHWLHGRVFPKPYYAKGKDPLSKEFKKWASSSGAKALLEATTSWLEYADAVVRYEDFIDDPEGAVKGLAGSLQITVSPQHLKEVTDDVKQRYLVNSKNQHRWSSSKNNWPKFITKKDAQKLYRIHQEVFDLTGYNVESDFYSSDQEIKDNCRNLW